MNYLYVDVYVHVYFTDKERCMITLLWTTLNDWLNSFVAFTGWRMTVTSFVAKVPNV